MDKLASEMGRSWKTQCGGFHELAITAYAVCQYLSVEMKATVRQGALLTQTNKFSMVDTLDIFWQASYIHLPLP